MPGIKDLIEDHRRDPDPHPRLQREIDARLDAIDEQIDNLTGAGDDALDVGDAIPQTVSLDDPSTPGTSRNASRDDHRHQWEVPPELEAIITLSGDGTVQRSESGDLIATQFPVVSGTNTAGSFRAINQEGSGVRLTAADANGVLDDLPEAVWTPGVPAVPIVPYASYVAPYDSSYTGANSPWGMDFSDDKIFWSSAYDWSFGQYNGAVVVFDRVTGTYSHFGPPEFGTYLTNVGFGSNVLVYGDYLYVGAYGWQYGVSLIGRIYKYNRHTLAYVSTVVDAGVAGGQLGRPGTMCGDPGTGSLFASDSVAYGAAGEIQCFLNDTLQGVFAITGALEFGVWLWMSPDKTRIVTLNKPNTGASAEIVILGVSGAVLTEAQRIANPGTAAYWGYKTRWDADSLGFWSTTADNLSYHYRWNGASFAAVTAPTFSGARIVCEANTPTQVYAEYSDTITLCDIVTGSVLYTWTGKADSNGWHLLRRMGTQFLVQHSTSQGVGIGSAEIPAVLPILDLAADLEAESLKITDQAGTGTRLVTAGTEGDQEAQSELTFDGTTLDIDAVVRANALVAGTDPGGSELLRVGGTAHIVGPLVLGTDPGGSEILRLGGGVRLTSTLTSTLATGTAPVSVTSTTVCPNLNASLLLGATWAAPAAIGSTTPAAGAFATVVVGTDPTGAQLLRVGGDVKASGVFTSGVPPVIPNTTGYQGMWAGTNYVAPFRFENSDSHTTFSVAISGSVAAGSAFGANNVFFESYNTGGATNALSFSAYNGRIRFQTNARTTRLQINTDGTLAIGTDPGGSEILRVGGGLRLTSTITSTLAVGTAPISVTSTTACPNLNASLLLGSTWAAPAAIGSTTPAAGAFTSIVLGTDPGGSELLRVGGAIKASGGINSGEYLSVYAAGSDSVGAGPYFYLGASGASTERLLVQASASGHLDFWAFGSGAWAKRMRLENGGSLVLGTDPGGSELLRVGGGVASIGHISVYQTSNPYLVLTDASGSAYVQLSSGDINLYPLPGKGITIGSNPGSSELLRVGGDIKLSGYVSFKPSTGYAIVGIAGDDVALFCGPGAETRLRAKQDGSVVIGTDPGGSELLRVGGSVRASAITSTVHIHTERSTAGDLFYGLFGGAIKFQAEVDGSGNGSMNLRNAAGAAYFNLSPSSLALTIPVSCSNLTVAAADYIYLRGDASTDGSVRMSSQSSGTAKLEARSGGTWANIAFT